MQAAVACLTGILDQGGGTRHPITAGEGNGQPGTSTEGLALLETAGFVRDDQGMTLDAAWRTPS